MVIELLKERTRAVFAASTDLRKRIYEGNVASASLAREHDQHDPSLTAPSWQRVLSIGVLAILLSLGCSQDAPLPKSFSTSTANHAPIVRSASIMPNPLTLTGPVYVQVDAEDQDRDEITFEYRWLVNGVIIPDIKAPTLEPEFLKRGDTVSVEISASDEHADTSVFVTKPSVVVNTAPILKLVTLGIESSTEKARLVVKVDASDPDGDEIRQSYRWWHNDQLVKEGSESFLANVALIRNDVFLVEATAHDQEADSLPIRSLPLTIGNTSPEIISKPAATFSRPLYTYKIDAKDADNDTLLYSLEIAPPGMMIDKTSGEIKWDIPSGFSGTHRIKVLVDDGRGGTNSQEFELSMSSSMS